ncbi:MAG TPA: carboxymuconolactone decarboxylase family protein [Balneolales bacterium]|nr:carboxymuconolactone decarboxylase family protein [Balneolales bacterium]
METIEKQKSWFEARAPEMAERWHEFHDSVYQSGELDNKSKELIAVAASTVGRCPHCTRGHIQKAKKLGASKEEITEALMITSLISSGTELHWMLEDYEDLLGANGGAKRWFETNAEEMGTQWKTFHDALYEDSALDRKTKELVAIAVAELRRCRHCTTGHIKAAKKFGATENEIAEAIMVAALIASGTQLAWMKEDYERLLGIATSN